MKKLAFIFAALITMFFIPVGTAEAQTGGFTFSGGSFDMDGFLQTFSNEYPNRSTIDYEDEKKAALYLAEMFNNLGYNKLDNTQAENNEDYLQNFLSASLKSNNVIAVKPAAVQTQKNVIIGAHYDNVYAYQQTNPYTRLNYSTLSNGAYDNGSGVAVMMSVASEIAAEELPFNVTFVAFGAEESGMRGSKHFIDSLTFSQKDNILLMINLDSIAAGDFVYLFCQDWYTEHDSYIREKADSLNVPLRALPFNKKYTADPFGSKLYSHYGHYSDNYYFVEENIPTAFFMSMNWESVKKAGVVESDLHNDIMHTSNDTYDILTELYPDTYLLHMQYVSEIVMQMLLEKDDFSAAMQSSRLNSPDYSFIMNERILSVAAFIVWLAFAVFAYFYGGRLKKESAKSIKEYMENPENAERINTILKGFPMPPFNNINYPPNTYKPKKGEKNFSVFGEEYDKKDDESESGGGSDSKNDDSGKKD